ncbi:MAG: GNAT family N-acetyltransferase [Kiloniellales bacterium]|nr:GNAT family N-acetyltransferase [Kiloniellales bacterium]
MQIRLATEADLDDLVRLNNQVLAQHARAHPSQFKFPADSLRVRRFFQRLLGKPALNCLVVAEVEGARTGYLWFERQNKRATLFNHRRRRLFVQHVCVDQSHQRRGVARALFEFVDKVAEEDHVDEVILNTWADNVDAQACFTALGFEPCRVTLWKRREGG